MSIYDNEGKRINKTIRLTPHLNGKLKRITELFGITEQSFFRDCVDYFFMEYLEVMSGRISYRSAVKDSTRKLFEDFIKLKEVKGLSPVPYSRHKKSLLF